MHGILVFTNFETNKKATRRSKKKRILFYWAESGCVFTPPLVCADMWSYTQALLVIMMVGGEEEF